MIEMIERHTVTATNKGRWMRVTTVGFGLTPVVIAKATIVVHSAMATRRDTEAAAVAIGIAIATVAPTTMVDITAAEGTET